MSLMDIVNAPSARRPVSIEKAVGLLLMDITLAPREGIPERRARIIAAKDARMEREADGNRDDLIEHDSNGMA